MAMASEGAIASTGAIISPSSFVNKLRSALSAVKMGPRKEKRKPQPVQASCAAARAPAAAKPDAFDCVFRYFDENGDGRISPGELRDCMKAVGEGLSLEQAEAVVQSADSDGDGMLGYEDFVGLVGAEGEEEKGRSLKEAFEVYEMEGEGCITAKSLRRALRLLGDSRSVVECEAMIRRFDENGDGVISFDEFRSMMMM